MRSRLAGRTPSPSPARLAAKSSGGAAVIIAVIAFATCAGLFAAPARAVNLFTLDHHAVSMGPVVVDESGNGYIAWLHKSGASATVMFCKLATGARSCAHPVTLPVALAEGVSETDTPFPVLGPGGYVYVVAPSYDTNQMVMWQSTDGGATFGPAAVRTPGPGETSACRVETNLDDVLAFNAYGAEYARAQGTATLAGGSPSNLEFEMSSSTPFVDWTFAFYGQGCLVPVTLGSSPGKLPWQYFPFGGGEIGGQESSLGWVSGGPNICPQSALGDEVDAYTDAATTPATVRFRRYSAPYGPCATTGENLSPSAAHNWSAPTTIGEGAFTRLAGGAAGLFLLSGDALTPGASQPTAVDVRRYELATHTFGAPTRLALAHGQDFDTNTGGGGLGESYTTGEVAAVWPDIGGASDAMSLFISTDGGAHFSAPQDIASVGGGYAGGDNARVALAANGTGFVTFEDASGLHVADLATLAAPYEHLRAHHRRTIGLPVTCEAPKGTCKASAKLEVKGQLIARGHVTVGSGLTATLKLVLNAKGRELLAHAKGRLGGSLRLTITHPGAPAERVHTHAQVVS